MIFSMYSAVYISHVLFSNEYVKHVGFESLKQFNFSFSYTFSIQTEMNLVDEGIFLLCTIHDTTPSEALYFRHENLFISCFSVPMTRIAVF